MRTCRRAAVLAVLTAFCIALLAAGPAGKDGNGNLGAGTTGIVRLSPVKARGLSA
jgi:hypothetical protein